MYQANSRKGNPQRRKMIRQIFRVRRAKVELTHEGATVPLHLVMNDISRKGVGAFSQFQFSEHTEVMVQFKDPIEVNCRMQVLWCLENISDSHIVAPEANFRYRLGLLFIPANAEERAQLEQFFLKLISEYNIYIAPPPASEAA